MARVCEICGRMDDQMDDGHHFEILDVCDDCSTNLMHTDTAENS